MSGLNLDEEKNDILGELDYFNSLIGLTKSFIKEKKVKNLLTDIQNNIFVIGVHIADPKNVLSRPPDITDHQIFSLQKETCFIERRLPKLNHFIIPEGTTAACLLHCARTVARQIERKLPGYLKEPSTFAAYFDRVAGLMFILARKINRQNGVEEHPPSYIAMHHHGFRKHITRERR